MTGSLNAPLAILFIVIVIPSIYAASFVYTTADVVPIQVGKCKDEGTGGFKFGTKLRRISKTQVTYSTNFTLPVDYDDNLQLQFDLFVWGNGGWRPNFYNFRMRHACRDHKTYGPEVMKELIRSMHVNFTSCPFPKGDYTMTDFKVNFKIQVPNFPRGKYKVETSQILQNETKVGCFMIVALVQPSTE